MNRRKIAIGGVAAAAGLAGVGVAWWRLRPHEAVPGPGADRTVIASGADAGASGDDAVTAFWKSSYDTPEGAPLAMSSFRGRPLLPCHRWRSFYGSRVTSCSHQQFLNRCQVTPRWPPF